LKRHNPYHLFLEELERPARYIGGEFNEIVKDWSQIQGKLALCFPDVYEVGMGHLGLKILYRQVNAKNHLLAERVFCPWIDAEKKIRENNLSLVSLETQAPLNEFDVVGFSLQYEMTISNILTMLDLGKIPLLSQERAEEHPIVIAGGPVAFNPEPMADIFDAFVIGDGEFLTVEILERVTRLRQEGKTRREILSDLASLESVYVPSLYELAFCEKSQKFYVQTDDKIRARKEDLSNFPFPTQSPIPHLTTVFDRFSLEVARGCTEGCRFCQAGIIYRPARERDPRELMHTIEAGIQKGGFEEVSLTCLSLSDYSAVTPFLSELLDKCSKDKTKIGIGSLRAYGLNEKIFDKLAKGRTAPLTFAPEAGSERLRKIINKNVTEKEMLETGRILFERGWDRMKLYFMIGLPLEEDSDIEQIVELASSVRQVGRRHGIKNPTVTVSASTFVPKAHTPFQWHGMISEAETRRRQNIIWDQAQKSRVGFKRHYSKISLLEGIFARGDRRLNKVAIAAYCNGSRFDGWEEQFNFEAWEKAFQEFNLDMEGLCQAIPEDGHLPWDHIDSGVTKNFLLKEWHKALQQEMTFPCLKYDGELINCDNLESLAEKENDTLVCHACGLKCKLKDIVEQRKEFLQALNATKKEEYIPPENKKASLIERRSDDVVSGHWYRFAYSKVGPISMISHLDLQKVILRVFKRAGYDFVYSKGYNQRPHFAGGAALPLGISSLSEFFDIELQQELAPDGLAQLQAVTERGLYLNEVTQIEKQTPSLGKDIHAFLYWVPLMQGDGQLLVEQLGSCETLEISSFVKSKKAYEMKDVKSLLLSFWQGALQLPEEQLLVIDEVSPCRNLSGIYFKVKVDNSSSIRPRELVQLIERLGGQAGRPIKLEAFFPGRE